VFEKFPDRFPENRNALAREIGIVLDALEARARNAIADLIPGRDREALLVIVVRNKKDEGPAVDNDVQRRPPAVSTARVD
jgi:hypothetical protein